MAEDNSKKSDIS